MVEMRKPHILETELVMDMGYMGHSYYSHHYGEMIE
jgi:hypothetical protein